jgi:methylenetetrahydrofolate reductase (NADPH)
VERLAPALGRPENNLQGFHLFTFNEVARTEGWRQEWLARLSDAVPT